MGSQSDSYFAAVDLGSNSFHMIICRLNGGTIEVVDRVKEMVQIARGMSGGELAPDAEKRSLDCLARFAERIADIAPSHVRAVGTKSLRSAKNAGRFLRRAERVLGHPIEIISGYEEARLVYLGLAHVVTHEVQKRLVVDIGGGSTEFIIGVGKDPHLLESLGVGCVVVTERAGLRKINAQTMEAARLMAAAEVETIRAAYQDKGWDIAYGTSGTIRAVADLLTPEDGGAFIRSGSLARLYQELAAGNLERLNDLPKLRRDVLPGGIAILQAIFEQLGLCELRASDATLKDGLLVETIGRFDDTDARNLSVQKLQKQFGVDMAQAKRVAQAAVAFWQGVKAPPFPGLSRTKLLRWSAELHEVGLGISHSSHHHHSYYILRHSDLGGFGRFEQHVLAYLVRAHRKKLSDSRFEGLNDEERAALMPLIVCLRLAALLHRNRRDLNVAVQLTGGPEEFVLTVPAGWLAGNPLTRANLDEEAKVLADTGLRLKIVSAKLDS